jgi:co-chaperonin GroES (HSP10)
MSKYLNKIKSGFESAGAANVCLIGSTLLVEIVKREKKTSSGILLSSSPSSNSKELTEAVVVATGAGFYDDETGEDKPLDTKVGDIIYVDPTHARLLGHFPVADYIPSDIALVEESAVLMRFRGEDAINAFRKGAGLND